VQSRVTKGILEKIVEDVHTFVQYLGLAIWAVRVFSNFWRHIIDFMSLNSCLAPQSFFLLLLYRIELLGINLLGKRELLLQSRVLIIQIMLLI